MVAGRKILIVRPLFFNAVPRSGVVLTTNTQLIAAGEDSTNACLIHLIIARRSRAVWLHSTIAAKMLIAVALLNWRIFAHWTGFVMPRWKNAPLQTPFAHFSACLVLTKPRAWLVVFYLALK
jgi:hypothetical protein